MSALLSPALLVLEQVAFGGTEVSAMALSLGPGLCWSGNFFEEGCRKKNMLHCLPEDMPKWTLSFVKQLAYVKAALSLYSGYASKHLLL